MFENIVTGLKMWTLLSENVNYLETLLSENVVNHFACLTLLLIAWNYCRLSEYTVDCLKIL